MKRVVAYLLTLVLCIVCSCALCEDSVNVVTIQEWLDAKGECGDCLLVVLVDQAVNPMLAIIHDETASVRLFAEVAAAEICDGDVLLLRNPEYNEYEGEVEMAFPDILRRIYTTALNASKRVPAEQYEFTASPDEIVFISDQVFSGEVSIIGIGQMVYFQNCEFKGNIVNGAPESTKVYISYDCEFIGDAHCIVNSGLTEADLYYDTPKFLLEKSVEVESAQLGGVIAMGEGDLVFNGVTYSMNNLQLVQKLDGSVVSYEEGMEDNCSMHGVMHWWENGEEVIVTVGIE